MKFGSSLRYRLAAAIFALALTAPGAAQQAAPQTQGAHTGHGAHAGHGAAALTNLQGLADRYVAEGKTANMVIGVAMPSGETAWVKAGTLAMRGTTPADEQSLYRIYSMTKPIVGLATALLIGDGKLTLDTPLSDIYPEFSDMQVLVDPETPGETRPATRPITIRNLITHTAGLGYSIVPSGVAELYRTQGIVPGMRRPNPMMPSGEQPASLDDFVSLVAKQPLITDPGTEWRYSIGLDVMGAVIQKVSGMPLEDFLQQRIFTPLGMDDTGFVVPQEDLGRLTTNYFLMDGSLIPIDNPNNSEYSAPAPFPSGGGGLASTGEDYLRFMTALANGGMLEGRQVLPAEAIALVTSNLLPEGVTYESGGYGAGGRVVTRADTGPMGSYGWGGAAGTLATALPAQGTAAVLMTQYMPQDAYPLPKDLAAALMADMMAMGAANDN